METQEAIKQSYKKEVMKIGTGFFWLYERRPVSSRDGQLVDVSVTTLLHQVLNVKEG
jgi:hypothetical protein